VQGRRRSVAIKRGGFQYTIETNTASGAYPFGLEDARMDGFQVLEWLRAHGHSRHTVLVLTTSDQMQD